LPTFASVKGEKVGVSVMVDEGVERADEEGVKDEDKEALALALAEAVASELRDCDGEPEVERVARAEGLTVPEALPDTLSGCIVARAVAPS
jgi:hypothetical protein